MTIVDRGLRHGAKHESSRGAYRKNRRQHTRYDVQAHEPREWAVAGDELKGPVRRSDQPSGKGDPLDLECVEDRGVGAAFQYRRELPRQVGGVADASVHSLAAHGTVDVR